MRVQEGCVEFHAVSAFSSVHAPAARSERDGEGDSIRERLDTANRNSSDIICYNQLAFENGSPGRRAVEHLWSKPATQSRASAATEQQQLQLRPTGKNDGWFFKGLTETMHPHLSSSFLVSAPIVQEAYRRLARAGGLGFFRCVMVRERREIRRSKYCILVALSGFNTWCRCA